MQNEVRRSGIGYGNVCVHICKKYPPVLAHSIYGSQLKIDYGSEQGSKEVTEQPGLMCWQECHWESPLGKLQVVQATGKRLVKVFKS